MRRTLATAAVALLTLTGCGADPEPDSPPAASAQADPTPSLAPTAGPATQPHTWPDGLTVRLVELRRMEPDTAASVPDGHTIIRATIELTNNSPTPVRIDGYTSVAVFYGSGFTEGETLTGYNDTDPDRRLFSKDPEQLPPGATLTQFDARAVPDDQLGTLAVRVNPDHLPDGQIRGEYTFTGAEQMIKQ